MIESNEQPLGYSEALVSYIDVLGFSGLIEASREDRSKIGRIARLLADMKQKISAGGHTHHGPDGQPEPIFHSYSFSDLTVRATRVADASRVSGHILWELIYLADTQLSFAQEEVLIRGGICIGDMFVDPESRVVFGPALVKSYKLESEFAIYPRIVIDRDLIQLARRDGYFEPLRDWVCRGEDGTYFLNYLYGSTANGYEWPTDEGPDPMVKIESHRNMIEAFISDHIKLRDERVKKKFMWLALYHNSTIARLKDRYDDEFSEVVDRYVISKDLLDF